MQLVRRLTLVSALSVAACGGNPAAPVPSMSLRCEPRLLTVTDAAARSTCTATSMNTLAGPVLFRCSGQGATIPCRFDPASVELASDASARTTLLIDVALGARPGPTTLQVAATGGGLTTTFDIGVTLADRCSGFVEQPSYDGDCRARPPGTICWGFEDGYRWFVNDGFGASGFTYACGDRAVSVARGGLADYHHVLGTLYVKNSPPTR